MKKLVFKIQGMNCSACAMMIDGDLEDIEGIKKASTNYYKSTTEVEFDESKISEEKILESIKSTGYSASLMG